MTRPKNYVDKEKYGKENNTVGPRISLLGMYSGGKENAIFLPPFTALLPLPLHNTITTGTRLLARRVCIGGIVFN